MRTILAAIGVGVLILGGSSAHPLCAAVDPANLCKEAKAKTAGKKAFDLLKAVASNVKRSNPAKLAVDISKADSKFAKGFSKAESRGSCPTTGDTGSMEAKVDAFVADLVLDIADPCCATHPGAIGFATVDIPVRPKCGEMRNYRCARLGTCYNGPLRQCQQDPDCPGSVCGGGDADGDKCENDSNCTGACSHDPAITCLDDTDCGAGNTCDNPAPGTCGFVCAGGTNDGSGCADTSDCPGGSCVAVTKVCKGGKRDSGACVAANDCPGGCSHNPAITCLSNPDCGTGNTCNNPAPGTCITPTCEGEGDTDLTSHMCLEGGPANQCQFGPCVKPPGVCTGDFAVSCSNDSDCEATCVEQTAQGFPSDIYCGALYTGGGNNSVPLPLAVPDKGVTVHEITDCSNGIMTLGPVAQTEIGSNYSPDGPGLNCSEGKKCRSDISPDPGGLDGNGLCAIEDHCGCIFGSGCCVERCLFGPPLPIPNTVTPPTSVCVRNVIAKDTSGTVDCNGGGADVTIPIAAVIHVTGDLLNASAPPDVPGLQSCPLCTKVCFSGENAGFPCVEDSDCSSNNCTESEQCLAGPNDGLPCTPQTSRLDVHNCCANGSSDLMACDDDADCGAGAPRCELSFDPCTDESDCLEEPNDHCIKCVPGCTSYPTSHDCPPDPAQDITFRIGGLPIDFSLTDELNTLDAADLSTLVPPNTYAYRAFCGYCRDMFKATPAGGTYCFEGDLKVGCPPAIPPADGNGVPCTSDQDCKPAWCVGGLNGGDICKHNSDCPGACSDDADITCLNDADCTRCLGGTNKGNLCTDASDCPGGTCVDDTCDNPTPGTCVARSRCLGGDKRGDLCTDNSECPASTCAVDNDEYESCTQRNPGAFSKAAATTFWSQGETDGQWLSDYQCHEATLVGIFCIPPTFDATIDAAGDLPGPAVSNLIGYQRLASTPDELDPGDTGTFCTP